IVGAGRTAQAPSGLARRRYAGPDGRIPVDEALRRELTWELDSAIVEWEFGAVGADLVEISEAVAARVGAGGAGAPGVPAGGGLRGDEGGGPRRPSQTSPDPLRPRLSRTRPRRYPSCR